MWALLVAYELTTVSLIKECNSIKSDYSHYLVHLGSLRLGSCYTHTQRHVHLNLFSKSTLKCMHMSPHVTKETQRQWAYCSKQNLLHMHVNKAKCTHESKIIFSAKQTMGPEHTDTSGDCSTGATVVLYQMLPRGQTTSTHKDATIKKACHE